MQDRCKLASSQASQPAGTALLSTSKQQDGVFEKDSGFLAEWYFLATEGRVGWVFEAGGGEAMDGWM